MYNISLMSMHTDMSFISLVISLLFFMDLHLSWLY